MSGFGGILGNADVVKQLQNALATGRISQCYIFDGNEGTGKKTIARLFAKGIQCKASTVSAFTPCGQCLSCKTFDSGNHPDVFFVEPRKTKAVSVDDVREQIIDNMQTKPYMYPYKVFIVNHASAMTPAAQNALLKTIEEPHAFGVFLFVSDNLSAFLPTVLSRAVICKMNPLPEAEIINYLVANGIDSNDARVCAEFSSGSLGYALKLASSETFANMRRDVTTALSALSEPGADPFDHFAAFEPYNDNIAEVLDFCALWYRNTLIQGNQTTVFDTGLIHAIDCIYKAKRILSHNGNFRLTIEMMLYDIHNHCMRSA